VIFIPVEDGPDSELDSGGWETDVMTGVVGLLCVACGMMLPDQERPSHLFNELWRQGAIQWWIAGELVMTSKKFLNGH